MIFFIVIYSNEHKTRNGVLCNIPNEVDFIKGGFYVSNGIGVGGFFGGNCVWLIIILVIIFCFGGFSFCD